MLMAIGDIGRRIKIARETYGGIGMKQNRLAESTGISQARISGWENGKHDPHPADLINRIARELGVSTQWLVTGDGQGPTGFAATPLTPRTFSEATGTIKVYGPVQAGNKGNVMAPDLDEIEVPAQFAQPNYGALIVEGDSMLPFLHPSDVVIFKDWAAEKPGHIMAAELEDGTWVVKMLVYDEEQYKLRSLNQKKYQDIATNFRLSGFLVGIVRDDGPERLIRLNPFGLKPDRSEELF